MKLNDTQKRYLKLLRNGPELVPAGTAGFFVQNKIARPVTKVTLPRKSGYVEMEITALGRYEVEKLK
jgi:hypothetical protein